MNFFSRTKNSLKASNFRAYFLLTGCCRVEEQVLRSSIYDLGRLGINYVEDSRDANVLMVGGWLNESVREIAKKTYQEMSGERFVIGVGTCAISGATFSANAKEKKILSDLLPVSVFVPGCPPHIDSYAQAFLTLREKVVPQKKHEEVLKSAIKSETIQV